ncbi:hypothetical protein B0H34DRAFT_716263 [Crassisporium funariophilum]|nr:hypothetical protein B0H34DRAFT_716263 [Crassisporium funariophilum]
MTPSNTTLGGDVRFSLDNIIIAQSQQGSAVSSSTPLPTLIGSSLSTSGDVILNLHPLFKPTAHLQWDISLDPTRLPRSHILQRHSQDEAIVPPSNGVSVTNLNLSCPLIPWKIPVQAENESYIQVQDITKAIYNCFQKKVKQVEIEKETEQRVVLINRALSRRQEELAQSFGVFEHEDVRRIDFLAGQTMFECLIAKSLHIWELHVRFC